MEERDTVQGFLSSAIGRLSEGGFTATRDVSFEGEVFLCAARRTKFELTKFGYSETFFVFAEFSTLGFDELEAFSGRGFRYALGARTNPLPRGFFASVFCFPVALVHSVGADTAQTVRNNLPVKHWSAAEVPVVYDLTSGALHYFEKTPMWGAAYYNGFRRTIQQMLG